jgi:biopolymer transport protein ExbD
MSRKPEPAMKLRRSRQPKRGRIEIIPLIDVMFFLLATFMLASLSMQHLNSVQVHLPRGAAEPMQKKTPVTLTVTPDSRLFLDKTPVTLDSLAPTLKTRLDPSDPRLIVAADHAAPNGIIVQAMMKAREAGAQHFLIAVRHGR